jgi:preprotein translocase subunit YajC
MPDATHTEILLTSDAAPAGNPQGSLSGSLFMIASVFAIFYFLVIRPQRKQQLAHETLVDSLKKGDRVITDGGLMGLVWEVQEDHLVLDFGDKTRIPFIKSAVKGLQTPPKEG